jgi:hypothetical protein
LRPLYLHTYSMRCMAYVYLRLCARYIVCICSVCTISRVVRCALICMRCMCRIVYTSLALHQSTFNVYIMYSLRCMRATSTCSSTLGAAYWHACKQTLMIDWTDPFILIIQHVVAGYCDNLIALYTSTCFTKTLYDIEPTR